MPFLNWIINTVAGRCITLIAGGIVSISSVLLIKPDIVHWEGSHDWYGNNNRGNIIPNVQVHQFKDSRKVEVIMAPPIHPSSQEASAAMTASFMVNTKSDMEFIEVPGPIPVTRTTESSSTHQDALKASLMPAQPHETSPPLHDSFNYPLTSKPPRRAWLKYITDTFTYLLQTSIVPHREHILYWLLQVATIMIGIQRRRYWDLKVIIEQLVWRTNFQQLTVYSYKSDRRTDLMRAMLSRKNVEIDTLMEQASVKDDARVSWIEYLGRQAESTNVENASLRGGLYAQNCQIQTVTEAANARDRESSGLHEQIEAQNSQIQRMTEGATTRQTENTTLRERIDAQNAQIQSLRAAGEARDGEISDLQEENGGRRSQIEAMTGTATAREAENADFHERTAAQNFRIQAMVEAEEGRDEEIGVQNSRIQAKTEAEEGRNEEIAALRQDVEKRDTSLEEARSGAVSQKTEIDGLTTQHHAADAEICSLRESLEQLQNDLAENNDIVSQRNEALEQLQEENFSLEDQVKYLNAQLQAETAREDEQKQKMEEMLSAISASEGRIKCLEVNNRLLREEAAQVNASASGMRAQMETQKEISEQTRLRLVAQVDAEIANYNVLEDDRDTWIEKYHKLSKEVQRLKESQDGGQTQLEVERMESTAADETPSKVENVPVENGSRDDERAVSSLQEASSEKMDAGNGEESAEESSNTDPVDDNDSPDGPLLKKVELKMEEIQQMLAEGGGRNAASALFEELLTSLSGESGTQETAESIDDSKKGLLEDDEFLIGYESLDEPVPKQFHEKIVETQRTLSENSGIGALRPLLSELWAVLDSCPAAKAETSHDEAQPQTSSLYEAFQPSALYTISNEPVELTQDSSSPTAEGTGNENSHEEDEAQTNDKCSDGAIQEGNDSAHGSGENNDGDNAGKAPSGKQDVYESKSSDPISVPAKTLKETAATNPALRSRAPSLLTLLGGEPGEAHVSQTQPPSSESRSQQNSDTGRSFSASPSPRGMNPTAAEFVSEVARILNEIPSTRATVPSPISPSHLGLPGPGEKEGEPLTKDQVEALLLRQVIEPMQRTVKDFGLNVFESPEKAAKEALSPFTISPGAQDEEDIRPSTPEESEIREPSSSIKAPSPPSGQYAATMMTKPQQVDAPDPFEETPITDREAEAAIFNVLQDVGTKSLSESTWAPGNEHMRPAVTTPTPAPWKQQRHQPQQQRPQQWRQEQQGLQHWHQHHQQRRQPRRQNQQRQPRMSAVAQSFARSQANIAKNTAENQGEGD